MSTRSLTRMLFINQQMNVAIVLLVLLCCVAAVSCKLAQSGNDLGAQAARKQQCEESAREEFHSMIDMSYAHRVFVVLQLYSRLVGHPPSSLKSVVQKVTCLCRQAIYFEKVTQMSLSAQEKTISKFDITLQVIYSLLIMRILKWALHGMIRPSRRTSQLPSLTQCTLMLTSAHTRRITMSYLT